jgi:predicted nucleic-acid-binding protein
MLIVDTNILIRVATNDDSALATKALKHLALEEEKYIPESVFPEIVYILRGVYKLDKGKISGFLEFLCQFPNMNIDAVVVKAIGFYSNLNLDFVDCLVLAHAEKLGGSIASFDRGIRSEGRKRGAKVLG